MSDVITSVPTDKTNDNSGPDFFGLRILLLWMSGFLLVALLALFFVYSSSWKQSSAMLIWAFGICSVGTIVGFLFAIPRVVSDVASPRPTQLPGFSHSNVELSLVEEVRRHRLAANTNLEQVSDWLTKIIVGVGLVELTKIPALLDRLAKVMAPSFGDPTEAVSVAIGVVLLFSAGGFLIGYVTTRAFLPHILQAAEKHAVDALITKVRAEAALAKAPAQP